MCGTSRNEKGGGGGGGGGGGVGIQNIEFKFKNLCKYRPRTVDLTCLVNYVSIYEVHKQAKHYSQYTACSLQ